MSLNKKAKKPPKTRKNMFGASQSIRHVRINTRMVSLIYFNLTSRPIEFRFVNLLHFEDVLWRSLQLYYLFRDREFDW